MVTRFDHIIGIPPKYIYKYFIIKCHNCRTVMSVIWKGSWICTVNVMSLAVGQSLKIQPIIISWPTWALWSNSESDSCWIAKWKLTHFVLYSSFTVHSLYWMCGWTTPLNFYIWPPLNSKRSVSDPIHNPSNPHPLTHLEDDHHQLDISHHRC